MKKKLLVVTVALIFTVSVILIACSSNKPSTQNPQTPQSNNANNTTNPNNTNTANNPSSTNNNSNTGNPTGKTFTLSDLAKYNGQNGNPAYVAVNGSVYDVTNARRWNNGTHFEHVAGTDLTKQIGDSPHGTSVLNEVPIVGTLK